MNAPFDSSQPTIDGLMAVALGLSKSSTPPEISAILKQAAAIDLMPLEIDALLDQIKGQTGAKISSLRKDHKTHQQNAKLSIPSPLPKIPSMSWAQTCFSGWVQPHPRVLISSPTLRET